jgi:uncharacterized protein (UPF0261 family)
VNSILKKKVIIVGSLDTKGAEYLYVKHTFDRLGVETYVIDTGVLDEPAFTPDLSSDEVARLAGSSLSELRRRQDRGKAVTAMAAGAAEAVKKLLAQDIVGGVFSMGGTAGTTVGAAAMAEVPIGIPKMLVSTVASGNTRPYVGVKDVTMMYSVVDISGLNRLSRRILGNAAYAMAGMVAEMEKESESEADQVTVGMTMFGVTTPCVTRVREILEQEGFDILVFHATGAGGLAMEELIRSGFIKAVADITTTELADDLVGGIFSAGASRLEAAAAAGIPQVVSVGALDMVNFGPPETVPEPFRHRKFYQHNPTTTLMRTTVEENKVLGKTIADKLNQAASPTVVVFPRGGISLIDKPGEVFEGEAERSALYAGIREHLKGHIPFVECDQDINDPAVAELIARQLLQLMKSP